jgi:hypothetical protein
MMKKTGERIYRHKGWTIYKAGPFPRFPKKYVLYPPNGFPESRHEEPSLDRAERFINGSLALQAFNVNVGGRNLEERNVKRFAREVAAALPSSTSPVKDAVVERAEEAIEGQPPDAIRHHWQRISDREWTCGKHHVHLHTEGERSFFELLIEFPDAPRDRLFASDGSRIPAHDPGPFFLAGGVWETLEGAQDAALKHAMLLKHGIPRPPARHVTGSPSEALGSHPPGAVGFDLEPPSFHLT